jgi:hypothetical protein
MGKRPSFGRSKSERGLDQFDTPPIALGPLFAHEPLLAGVKTICEPFCGLGNLVLAMRARGLVVHASDIQDRGCPDSTVLDFLAMTERPPDCDVLVSNPPFSRILEILEHAWRLGFRVVILLMEPSFMHSAERFERLHQRGHLRRTYPLAERLKDMHDANFKGKKGSQPRMHCWYVFDRDYCGHATTIPVSINDPTARMPWQTTPHCEQCAKFYQPRRSSSRFCSATCRQRAHRSNKVSVTDSVTPIEPSDGGYEFRYVRHSDISRFLVDGWERLSELDGTHHAEYASLMRRRAKQDEGLDSLIG